MAKAVPGRFNDGELLDAEEWDTAKDAPQLFHGTSSKNLPGLLKEGFAPESYWGSEWVAKYFAKEECKAKGGKPVILMLDLSRFNPKAMAPDLQMAEFPIFKDYDVREDAWEDIEDSTWEDSLRILEAVVFKNPLAITLEDVISGAPAKKAKLVPV